MKLTSVVNQAALWNATAGQAWVDAQVFLDQLFEPFESLIVGDLDPSTRVLDVGCGTGAIALAAARRLAPGMRCLGVDISEQMIATAQARARAEDTSVEFMCDDAATHAFEAAGYDLIVSRFGVMFFDDPVKAFVNLRRAASADGRLRFAAWRSSADNPFMIAAEHAAAPLLPALTARVAGAAGQFAFADRSHVERILSESGWRQIEITPMDVPCSFPKSELTRYLTRMGPVGRALAAADDELRARVFERIRPAFDAYVSGNEVRFSAACWLIEARA